MRVSAPGSPASHDHSGVTQGGLLKVQLGDGRLIFFIGGTGSAAANIVCLNTVVSAALVEPANYIVQATETAAPAEVQKILRKTYTHANFNHFTIAKLHVLAMSNTLAAADRTDLYCVTDAAQVTGSIINYATTLNALSDVQSANFFANLAAHDGHVLTIRGFGSGADRLYLHRAELLFT